MLYEVITQVIIVRKAQNIKKIEELEPSVNNPFKSVYGSTSIVDQFNIANKIYKAPQKVEDYIDPSLVLEMEK